MTTLCGGCNALLLEDQAVGRFIPCRCGRFTPTGARLHLEINKVNIQKGGQMGNKETITEFMKGKESISLKDIYLGLPNLKPHVIRATLNLGIKKNDTFERIDKGKYKLK